MLVNVLVRSPGFEVNGELSPVWAAVARLSQAPPISVADHGDATSGMSSRYLRRPPTEAASCSSRFPNVSRLSDDTADTGSKGNSDYRKSRARDLARSAVNTTVFAIVGLDPW